MAKFLYIQDGHCSGRNSINRLGDYFSDWLKKWDEIISIAKKNKCQAILDGGDLFESKNASYSIIDEIADRIEKAEISVYSLLGNHVMEFGHVENSKNSALYHLQKRSKYFKRLIDYYDKTIHIVGIDYEFGIEEKLKVYPLLDFGSGINEEKKWKIGIVHALVTPKKFFENVSYVTPEQLKTNADLILLAHYHHPFEKKIKNTTFLNIGCFGRLNINEAKIQPSVLLLDTNNRSWEIIPLRSAKPANKIFDLSKYEEIKKQNKSIDDFINSLNSAEWVKLDVLGQIERFAKDNGFGKEVVDYILEKVENKNE